MDIFALGCVIAETYEPDNKFLFNYEKIFQYKRGQYNPEEIVKKIENKNIQNLIYKMIDLESENRMTIEQVI